jgi:hypothetical protein
VRVFNTSGDEQVVSVAYIPDQGDGEDAPEESTPDTDA